ncbi:MAG: MFS transporter [Planctomycetes bacterium]|nr:MFS transporter [Planctomycetota bacterium]
MAHSRGGLGDRLLSLFWRKPPATLAERTRRRVALHLIPLLFFLYILAYLDRVNVSVAQLTMIGPEAGIGFNREIIGLGTGIFFWGYWILEVPSTVCAVRWGARWVFAPSLMLWGLCAALVGTIGMPFCSQLFQWLPGLTGWPNNPEYQFYILRFLLGFFEGAFFPTVIVYLSHWFRTQDRAKAIAGFMSAIPISSALGSPFSGLLLKVHWGDLPGWRWIFLLEGITPLLAGFATLFVLPDRPATARWLPDEERAWLMGELEREHQAKKAQGHGAWRRHLGMVVLLTLVYFCLNVSSYGLSAFMPAIIQSQMNAQVAKKALPTLLPSTVGLLGSPLGQGPWLAVSALLPGRTSISDTMASCLAALPFVVALGAMLFNGRHSDHTRERPWHVAVPLTLLSLSLVLAAEVDGLWIWPAIVMVFCVGACMYTHLPAFWPIPSMFLGATAAAAAIGFINMLGNLGGSVGPTLVGKASNDTTSFAHALLLLAPWPLAGAVIILILGWVHRRAARQTGAAAPPAPVDS